MIIRRSECIQSGSLHLVRHVEMEYLMMTKIIEANGNASVSVTPMIMLSLSILMLKLQLSHVDPGFAIMLLIIQHVQDNGYALM